MAPFESSLPLASDEVFKDIQELASLCKVCVRSGGVDADVCVGSFRGVLSLPSQ